MQIKFDTKKLAKTVSDATAFKSNYGPNAKKVKQRLEEMAAAETLADLNTLPPTRCHVLSNGHYAVNVSPNHRIIFKADHHPLPTHPNGGLDLSRITQICILEINVDYH